MEKLKQLQLLIKARVLNTLFGLKTLLKNKVVVLHNKDFIHEFRLFLPVLDMRFFNGIKKFERTYRMDTKLKNWTNKHFHETIVCICGFGFGYAKSSKAFLNEIQALEEMEHKLNNVPSYATPARIKEYKDRVKKLEETSYGE